MFSVLIVAKRKSLFDDKPVEIQELTYIIKEDINSLNKQIAQLQQIAKGQHGQHGGQKQSHSNSVVVTLQVKKSFPIIICIAQLVRVLDLRTRGCGFDSQAGQSNNY